MGEKIFEERLNDLIEKGYYLQELKSAFHIPDSANYSIWLRKGENLYRGIGGDINSALDDVLINIEKDEFYPPFDKAYTVRNRKKRAETIKLEDKMKDLGWDLN